MLARIQFQDPPPEQVHSRHERRGIEHWLRRLVFEDWTLKLLALLITFVLWFAVTGQKKPITKRFSAVQLSFLQPEGLEISNEPPTRIDVTLTGSGDVLDRINPMALVVTVNVFDQAAGDRVIRLGRAPAQ